MMISVKAARPGPQRLSLRTIFSFPLVLPGILFLAFAARFYRIDFQSVWHDEAFALGISRLPFAQMNQALLQDIVHPPLHYYLLHWWFQVFGFGALQARLLSLVWGSLAVLMLYVLARYLFDRATAWLSALLLALSQLAITYSQEARPYAQCLLIVVCCAYFFIRAVREKNLLFWIAFLVSAALLLYTHYYGFFALLALLIFGVIYRKHYALSRAWLLGGMLWLALAYTPWLAGGALQEAFYGRFHSAKRPAPAKPVEHVPAGHWYTPITILNSFNNGRPNGLLEAAPWWSFVLGGVLFSVPAAAALACLVKRKDKQPSRHERENVAYLFLLTVVPVMIGLAIAYFAGVYAIRYIAFCAAPYYILVARGISATTDPVLRRALIVCIFLYCAHALKANYFVPDKEDYKNAFASIARDYRPGDCAAVAQFWEQREARWAWSIQEGNRPGPEIRPLESILSARSECERVWLISVYHRGNPIAVKVGEAARQRLSKAFSPGERRRYFWVNIDLFTRSGQEVRRTD